MAVSLDHRRHRSPGLGPIELLVGMTDDPFTAPTSNS